MNVSATILGDTAKHVLAVPVAAVNRGNTVLVAGAGALGEDGTTVVDLSKAEERPIGGLGIFLIKQMMDDVRYERLEGHNILIMKKNI